MMGHFLLPALLMISYATAQATCPGEWWDLAADLKSFFIEDGTCSDSARGAIRLAFHDCFPGSCDGSMINAAECSERQENAQMADICSILAEKASDYGVGTADIIQFAAAIGLASCSGGPIISFYAGRYDSYTETPQDSMPVAETDAETMVDMFTAKGFSKMELVALTGAHTIGRQLDGTPMDRSMGEWDNKFYNETLDNSAPRSVAADRFMAEAGETGEEWRYLGKSQNNFMNEFIPAMEKLSLMGNDKDSMVDCSEIIRDYSSNANVRKRVLLKGRKLE